jgi:hypothetical protein
MECLAVSFALDLGCFDDWPPFLDLSLLQGAKVPPPCGETQKLITGRFHDVLPAMVSVTQGFACTDLVRLNFGNVRPPTAPTLPLIGGTTAGPAGSSRGKLQRLLAFT